MSLATVGLVQTRFLGECFGIDDEESTPGLKATTLINEVGAGWREANRLIPEVVSSQEVDLAGGAQEDASDCIRRPGGTVDGETDLHAIRRTND